MWDMDGYGMYMLFMVVGWFVLGVNFFGYGNGMVKGGVLVVYVVVYKVCWCFVNGSECFDVDIIVVFDVVIYDGVYVFFVFLGGLFVDYFCDGFVIGLFYVVSYGVIVVCLVGNFGFGVGIVFNIVLWLFIVGVSIMDSEFFVYLVFDNNKWIKVSSS